MQYLILLLTALFISAAFEDQTYKHELTGSAQGTTYRIIYFEPKEIISKIQIDSILVQIDSSLSLYKPYSLINKFNDSKDGIDVDDHFLHVISKSLETYKKTHGIFDVTVQPLVQAWGFGVIPIKNLPDSASIQSIKKCIGSDMIKITKNKIYKTKPCLKIDLNGIAQGYSVDVLAKFLEKKGIKNYMVELGGEIRVKGRRQPDNLSMTVGIEMPHLNKFEPGYIRRTMKMNNGAVTTAGSYRRYYESEGKKINHIIDPRTGYTVQNELISVTVFANDAITADAFDSALMIMGLPDALQFVESNDDIAAYFIYKNNDIICDTASTKFYKLFDN